MRTFLFTWNPKLWPWTYLDKSISQIESQGFSDDKWSCGVRRDIDIDDRFFLIRLGPDKPGLVGSGIVTSMTFDRPHWDQQRASVGDTAISVKVRFDAITNEPAIPIAELEQPPFDNFNWHPRSGGMLIPLEIAAAVEQLWASRISAITTRFPEELPASPTYVEGLARQVVVNAYERNEKARSKCLAHHGYACVCCGILLEAAYGEIAQDFIHVHHLVPLCEIGEAYVVDPVNDLVPVCPNCHAIIHRRTPPLSIGEVKVLLATIQRTQV